MKESSKTLACAVAVIALVLTGMTWAQPGGGQGGQGGFGGPGGNFDPEQMRARMNERIMQSLGASEQEWKVIEPLYTKVTELQRSTQTRGRFGRMGMMGMMGGPGGPQGMGGPGQDGDRQRGNRSNRNTTQDGNRQRGNRQRGMGGPGGIMEETAVSKAQEALSTVLEKENATPEEIKAALTKLRAEKEKARQELAQAQEALRKVLSLKQEATLVMMGTLD